MSKICKITGKRPITGNKRSYAMNAIKRRFLPNIHYRKFWIEKEKKFIKIKISSKGLRIIDKKGIDYIISNLKIFNKKTNRKR